jgi:hypothetical protein
MLDSEESDIAAKVTELLEGRVSREVGENSLNALLDKGFEMWKLLLLIASKGCHVESLVGGNQGDEIPLRGLAILILEKILRSDSGRELRTNSHAVGRNDDVRSSKSGVTQLSKEEVNLDIAS